MESGTEYTTDSDTLSGTETQSEITPEPEEGHDSDSWESDSTDISIPSHKPVAMLHVVVVREGRLPESYTFWGDSSYVGQDKDSWHGAVVRPSDIPDHLASLYDVIPGLERPGRPRHGRPRRVTLGKRKREALLLWRDSDAETQPLELRACYRLYIDM